MNILELAILKKMVGGGGGSGTDNYNDLSNLPQINGETLAGNKTAENLGLQDALTFDSAPTEDSTNPVESGGVYNALAGKQDNLTFDDDPTENSTNPVKSGGVYSALAGKQDNLTFDGVYNASTNKAATESTVTNAIAGLDVSAFSVDADETISSISETDGKINVTKQDIAIASNQVTAMTGYTKPSSAPATPAIQTSDTANQAFGKLEFKADTNQSNILYVGENGVKNVFPVASGTTSHSDGTLFDKIALHLIAGSWDFSWTSTATPTAGTIVAYDSNKTEITRIAVPSGSTSFSGTLTLSQDAYYVTLYVGIDTTVSNIMCKPSWMSNDYQPPALPNYDLTYLQAEDRAALAEEIDAGAKNKLKISGVSSTVGEAVFTVSSDGTISVYTTATTTTQRSLTITASTDGVTLNANDIVSGVPSSDNKVSIEWGMGASGNTKSLWGNNTDGYETVGYTGSVRYFAVVISSGKSISSSSPLVFKPMVCTKAAFGVSQKFTPYRVPITGVYSVIRKLVACSTTETTTGIKFTSTESACYRISVTAMYSASKPMTLRVKQKTNSSDTFHYFLGADSVTNCALSVSGMMQLGIGGEFEVFAKYETAADNHFYVVVEKIG